MRRFVKDLFHKMNMRKIRGIMRSENCPILQEQGIDEYVLDH